MYIDKKNIGGLIGLISKSGKGLLYINKLKLDKFSKLKYIKLSKKSLNKLLTSDPSKIDSLRKDLKLFNFVRAEIASRGTHHISNKELSTVIKCMVSDPNKGITLPEYNSLVKLLDIPYARAYKVKKSNDWACKYLENYLKGPELGDRDILHRFRNAINSIANNTAKREDYLAIRRVIIEPEMLDKMLISDAKNKILLGRRNELLRKAAYGKNNEFSRIYKYLDSGKPGALIKEDVLSKTRNADGSRDVVSTNHKYFDPITEQWETVDNIRDLHFHHMHSVKDRIESLKSVNTRDAMNAMLEGSFAKPNLNLVFHTKDIHSKITNGSVKEIPLNDGIRLEIVEGVPKIAIPNGEGVYKIKHINENFNLSEFDEFLKNPNTLNENIKVMFSKRGSKLIPKHLNASGTPITLDGYNWLDGVTVTPKGNRETTRQDWREANERDKINNLINEFTGNIRKTTGDFAENYVAPVLEGTAFGAAAMDPFMIDGAQGLYLIVRHPVLTYRTASKLISSGKNYLKQQYLGTLAAEALNKSIKETNPSRIKYHIQQNQTRYVYDQDGFVGKDFMFHQRNNMPGEMIKPHLPREHGVPKNYYGENTITNKIWWNKNNPFYSGAMNTVIVPNSSKFTRVPNHYSYVSDAMELGDDAIHSFADTSVSFLIPQSHTIYMK